MNTRHFDVIVIGGGPAGSAAARTAAGAGLTVCVVDKCVFPRDKLCGGLLTLRSRNIFEKVFGASWDPVIEVVSRDVSFYHKNRLLNSVEDHRDLYFTSRRDFDDYLLRLAEKAGAHLLLGNAVRGIHTGEQKVFLEDSPALTYKYLVGADGVNSMVARALFGKSFSKATIAFGMETEVPVGDRHERIAAPEVHLGAVRWGYGWVFPKKDVLTAGVAGLHRKNPDLKAQFLDFLRMRFGEIPKARIRGHYIPFGEYRKEPGNGNVLLCGDAAGLVDPITGEGIAFAMKSGYFSALSIAEAVKNGAPATALKLYRKRYAEISSALDHAKLLRALIFPEAAQRIFLSALPGTRTVPRKHMDLLAGEIEYDQYTRFLAGKLGKAALKQLLPLKSLLRKQ